MKKVLLTILLTIILGFISMHYGTKSFVYSDPEVVSAEDQPIHFQLNPVLWLPAYYIFNNDITDFTIVKSVLWTLPYWALISFLLTNLLLKIKKFPSPEMRRGVRGEVV